MGGAEQKNSNIAAPRCLENTTSDDGEETMFGPQLECYAEKQATRDVPEELLKTQVNPAVWEIGGHMVLKRRKDYDDASEENACRLLAEVSLSEERFRVVKIIVLEAAGLQEVKIDGSSIVNEEESLPSPRGPCGTSHLPQEIVCFSSNG